MTLTAALAKAERTPVAQAWSPDGDRLVTVDVNGAARIWTTDAAVLRDRLWEATPVCLSPRRRMELLDEDTITAERNASDHRTREAERRAARPR
jgi:hypothetical protein